MSMFSMHSAKAAPFRDRSLEGIEVDHQEVDRRDGVLGRLRFVRRVAAHGEQPAVDLGMQRLHAPVEHLRKAGELGHVLDGEPSAAQHRGGAARRDQLDAHLRQRLRKLDEPRLVRHRKERASDPALGRHGYSSPNMRAMTQLTSHSP